MLSLSRCQGRERERIYHPLLYRWNIHIYHGLSRSLLLPLTQGLNRSPFQMFLVYLLCYFPHLVAKVWVFFIYMIIKYTSIAKRMNWPKTHEAAQFFDSDSSQYFLIHTFVPLCFCNEGQLCSHHETVSNWSVISTMKLCVLLFMRQLDWNIWRLLLLININTHAHTHTRAHI